MEAVGLTINRIGFIKKSHISFLLEIWLFIVENYACADLSGHTF